MSVVIRPVSTVVMRRRCPGPGGHMPETMQGRRGSPDGVRRLLASVVDGTGRPPLEVVREAFTSTRVIERRPEELQIETEFWNRFG